MYTDGYKVSALALSGSELKQRPKILDRIQQSLDPREELYGYLNPEEIYRVIEVSSGRRGIGTLLARPIQPGSITRIYGRQGFMAAFELVPQPNLLTAEVFRAVAEYLSRDRQCAGFRINCGLELRKGPLPLSGLMGTMTPNRGPLAMALWKRGPHTRALRHDGYHRNGALIVITGSPGLDDDSRWVELKCLLGIGRQRSKGVEWIQIGRPTEELGSVSQELAQQILESERGYPFGIATLVFAGLAKIPKKGRRVPKGGIDKFVTIPPWDKTAEEIEFQGPVYVYPQLTFLARPSWLNRLLGALGISR